MIGYMFLYMVIVAIPTGLIALIYGENGELSSEGALAAVVVLILAMILIIPFMNFVIKRTFYFQGEGNPAPVDKLRSQLTDVNSIDAPVTVTGSDGTLVATWRYADAKWSQLIGQKELQKVYELRMEFHPDSHEVLLTDITKSKKQSIGLFDISARFSFSRGVIDAYDRKTLYGLREDFTVGEVVDYEFTPSEIKTPVMNTILTHGWDVRYSLW